MEWIERCVGRCEEGREQVASGADPWLRGGGRNGVSGIWIFTHSRPGRSRQVSQAKLSREASGSRVVGSEPNEQEILA